MGEGRENIVPGRKVHTLASRVLSRVKPWQVTPSLWFKTLWSPNYSLLIVNLGQHKEGRTPQHLEAIMLQDPHNKPLLCAKIDSVSRAYNLSVESLNARAL